LDLTAITTPFGLFEFPFMSFGLRTAAQTFQRFMDDVLRGLDCCFAYLDDKSGILINPVKCVFRVPEITFLGYKVSAEGSQPLEERVTHL
jgi:hypothetical protein